MTTPSSLDSIGFAKLWKSLYDPALALSEVTLLAGSEDNSLPVLLQHRKRVHTMLQAMAKVIFGADEGKKAIAIVYGIGCLELCMKLVKSARVDGFPTEKTTTTMSQQDQDVWRSGLKVVKCSVIQCKVGRARCRKAEIFDFIRSLLERALPLNDSRVASLVEECMTTLAAICLGDDLNTLQAAVQLREHVDQAANKYSQQDYPGMHQKIHYLTTLFDITMQEERVLIEDIDTDTFFDSLIQAELALWEGIEFRKEKANIKALERCTAALGTIQTALNGNTSTKVLHSLKCQLYGKRANIHLELESFEAALQDADALTALLDTESAAQAHILRARALEGMGEVKEAKGALGTALLVSPQDEALRAQLERQSVDE